MEYTKGEWSIQEDDAVIEIYVPIKGTVAKLHKRWNDNTEANANLISSAPDMYEALKTAVVLPDFAIPGKLYVEMKKAIAKAEGKYGHQ